MVRGISVWNEVSGLYEGVVMTSRRFIIYLRRYCIFRNHLFFPVTFLIFKFRSMTSATAVCDLWHQNVVSDFAIAGCMYYIVPVVNPCVLQITRSYAHGNKFIFTNWKNKRRVKTTAFCPVHESCIVAASHWLQVRGNSKTDNVETEQGWTESCIVKVMGGWRQRLKSYVAG